ncbi:MAG: pyridoxamine 5'-phosphate oxidase family protein [Candidatus Nezhaarchaeota archaeon]|nr:pyridoxamine 5'-phosphate oxidase family protein [Candidatus Nezhaarchaeota archaeon]
MVKIPPNILKLLEELAPRALCIFATASRNGKPNAVPIVFAWPLNNEEIIIADNFFNKTRLNIEENPQAALSFWNPETREGYQIKGKVELHISGPLFEEVTSRVRSAKPNLKPKACVLLKAEEVYSVKPGPEAGKKVV